MSSAPPLEIAAPCPKEWETMHGDEKRRFCDHCQRHVHNLSAMTTHERERLIARSSGQSCIAYELRADGTMITPARWPWLHAAFACFRPGIAALLAAVTPLAFTACASRRTLGKPGPPHDSAQAEKARAHSGARRQLGTPAAPRGDRSARVLGAAPTTLVLGSPLPVREKK